jgi:hypothetical protein
MRQVTETIEELSQMDDNGRINYVWEHYPGAREYTYDDQTFLLTVQLRFLEEPGRMDLVNIEEPLIAFNIISGAFTEAYVQENYPASYGKPVYPDATGHSLGLQGDQLGLLTVWFD